MSFSELGTQTHESIDSSCQKRYKKKFKGGESKPPSTGGYLDIQTYC